MKFTIISLLSVLLVGTSATTDGTTRLRPPTVTPLRNVSPTLVCIDEPLSAPVVTQPEVSNRSTIDPKPIQPPEPVVTIHEPPRPWLLSDKTWQALAESRVNIDVSLDHGDEYIGVRIILPFGS